MAKKIIDFAFGRQTKKLALPRGRVINHLSCRPGDPVKDVPAAVRQALRHPIGTPPLSAVVKAGDKVAVIVGDITRAWVKFDHFLPVLLDELNEAGVPDRDIFIIIGMGAHRKNTDEENVRLCGEIVCDRVPIYQHDCYNEDELVHIGRTSRGIECYLNKRVADADKMILTGGISYHFVSGFGGGPKAAVPGVSGFSSIISNHVLCMSKVEGEGLDPSSATGNIKGNLPYEDMLEQAALAKPDFLFNAVMTPDGQFAKFVAGHWHEAWQAGIRMMEDIYGVPIAAQTDLVVASAGGSPKDSNLYFGVRALDNAHKAVKPGGVIICFLECADDEPPEFAEWLKYWHDISALETALRKNFDFSGLCAYKIADFARRESIIVITLPKNLEFMRKSGMIPVVEVAEALAIAKEKLGSTEFTITLMPDGANTVPIL